MSPRNMQKSKIGLQHSFSTSQFFAKNDTPKRNSSPLSRKKTNGSYMPESAGKVTESDVDLGSEENSVLSNEQEVEQWNEFKKHDKNQLEILIDSTVGFTYKMKKMILDYCFISQIVFKLENKIENKVNKLQAKFRHIEQLLRLARAQNEECKELELQYKASRKIL